MPGRYYTPDFVSDSDPGQGRVPDDVDPQRVLLVTMFALSEERERGGLNPCGPVRYTLIARRTGLPGQTIRWHMRRLVNDGVAYAHRNGWGLTRRGRSIAAAVVAGRHEAHATEPRRRLVATAPQVLTRMVCEAFFALYAKEAARGEVLLERRFGLQDLAEHCDLTGEDILGVLEVMGRAGLVRFDGGYALTERGMSYGAERIGLALDELLERAHRAQQMSRGMQRRTPS